MILQLFMNQGGLQISVEWTMKEHAAQGLTSARFNSLRNAGCELRDARCRHNKHCERAKHSPKARNALHDDAVGGHSALSGDWLCVDESVESAAVCNRHTSVTSAWHDGGRMMQARMQPGGLSVSASLCHESAACSHRPAGDASLRGAITVAPTPPDTREAVATKLPSSCEVSR